VNILFVNYGDFTTNSLNHIGGFANTLCATGHACVVAVARGKETLAHVPHPRFIAATYDEVLAQPALFPDGRVADLVHAWTPREGVRKFVVAYQRLAPTRLIVHLEDNEEFLVEAFAHQPFAELRGKREHELPFPMVDGIAHPTRFHHLLRLADAVTYIVDCLAEFVPPGTPGYLLEPGVDASLYAPRAASSTLRHELGLRDGERVIAYTGSVTFANAAEVRDLYLAVKLLNERGSPTRLLRTGFTPPDFAQSLGFDPGAFVTDFGFVDKARLPRLLALADALVQPGQPGLFNDYRLPSKIPEFLAMGKPVILPATNVGTSLADGRDALLLFTGTPEEIAAACQRVFADAKLAGQLGKNAAAFARAHFDLAANTAGLAAFYARVVVAPAAPEWRAAREPYDSEIPLLIDLVRRRLAAALDSAAPAGTETWREILASLEDLALAARETDYELFDRHRQLDALRQHTAGLEDTRTILQRDTTAVREKADYLEKTLAAVRQHAAGLEEARTILQQDIASVRQHAEAAIALVHQHTEAAIALVRQETAAAITVERERADAERLRAEAEREHAAAERLRTEIMREQFQLAHESTRREVQALETKAARLDAARQQVAEKFSALQRDAARNYRGALDLFATATRLENLLHQRDVKIRQMQASASWKFTAWLRALRRRFVDPYFGKPKGLSLPDRPHAVQLALTEFAPPPAPALQSHLDAPRDWSAAAQHVTVRGWVFTEEPVGLRQVRARIGDRFYPGTYGLERPDVGQNFPAAPLAAYSGFKIGITIQDGDEHVDLEIADDSGTWHGFLRQPLRRGAGQAARGTFADWVQEFDTLTPSQCDALRARAAALPRQPLISILLPVYNTAEPWLAKAIESVRAQVYPTWELCIADDASTRPDIRPLLEKFAREDPRIKVVFRSENGHICAASNSALETATGEFAALLDHDDELSPHALLCLAETILAHPDAEVIYSDEDKIDESGFRFDPHFKPDWNPDLLTGQNYFSHLASYRTATLRAAGGFRTGFEGSQDWDVALRLIERVQAAQIHHIPRILYHWRAVDGSTAMHLQEKDYATLAARRALEEHFARTGDKIMLRLVRGGHWHVQRPRPDPAPLVTLVIPTRNRRELLIPCVESLFEKTAYPNFEILVADNDSDDPELLAFYEKMKARGRFEVLPCPGPFNFSAINNRAVQHARGEIVGLLNNDLEVMHPGWLDEMVANAVRPGIGCVGAKLYYPDFRLQHAGVITGLGGVAGHAFKNFPREAPGTPQFRPHLVHNVSAVTAACLVIRKSVFTEAGGFEEHGLKIAFNDVDFCLRVQSLGYRNLYTPFAEFIHHESASRGLEDTPEKIRRFQTEIEFIKTRWGGRLLNDPAYNPNFTLDSEDFALAYPPRVPPLA